MWRTGCLSIKVNGWVNLIFSTLAYLLHLPVENLLLFYKLKNNLKHRGANVYVANEFTLNALKLRTLKPGKGSILTTTNLKKKTQIM